MPFLKGGAWKNSEDEVLKAAVMKYGLNEWDRISSLLTRKTPKQCKARWYDWLDPAVKKVEWSRDEDERLLHLAKLMPTQWRTIAPVVGRTAAQCLDRYQLLLDEAERRRAGDQSAAGGDSNGNFITTADDLRKLRPGEIDPNIESKPARPDAVDMDDDEKEMLMEARARMANTQGKKAKRKARDKQLDEAKRQAAIRKRRDLIATGVEDESMQLNSRWRGEIDWSAEIPFAAKVPAGYYDTMEEKQRPVEPPTFDAVKHGRKGDRNANDPEQSLSETKDTEQKRLARQAQIEQQSNEMLLRKSEQESLQKRRKLQMPQPQIGDAEFEEMAKIGHSGNLLRSVVAAQGGSLMAGRAGSQFGSMNEQSRSDIVPSVALRTPLMSNVLNQEADNLLALQNAATPLLGGPVTEWNQNTGTGFEGSTPARVDYSTPHVLHNQSQIDDGATIFNAAADGRSLKNQHIMSHGQVVAPNVDNDEDLFGLTDAADFQKTQLDRLRKELTVKFKLLSEPNNDFEIVLSDDDDSNESGHDGQVMFDSKIAAALPDAFDKLQQQRTQAGELWKKRFLLASQLSKRRDLTFPQSVPTMDELPTKSFESILIANELIALLEEDVEGADIPEELLSLQLAQIANVEQLVQQQLQAAQ